MRPSFHPRLVNPPLGDPGLFIPFFFEKRALMFDLGDIHSLPPKELLKLTHVFVSHTHMDHFIGFDHLLRIFLGREKTLHLFGPPPFIRNVEGKLSAYTWNLVHNYPNSFNLKVAEVHPNHIKIKTYESNRRFRAHRKPIQVPFSGILVEEPEFRVSAIHLDHKIPCLGFTIQECFRVNIMKDRLRELDLPVGPWLKRFKEALYDQRDLDQNFEVAWKDGDQELRQNFRLGELAKRIALITPGQKITYITDVLYSPENVQKIVAFAQGADQLFIEAAFLDEDKERAQTKFHLTAKQAGTIARKARVKRFTIFHISPRYTYMTYALQKEAEEAFQGPQAG
nr:ribonuclease Z [Desulfobacterales bacterium]